MDLMVKAVRGVVRMESVAGRAIVVVTLAVKPGWNQAWREPLRAALNFLARRCGIEV